MRRILLALLCLAILFSTIPANSQQASSAAKSAVAQKPSTANIAAARTAHQVWVNLDTGIYHKSGRWYGKTKNGKFMSEADAKKAGYKASKRQ